MKREDAARKVRALLATAAPGSGATDPERATAQRLAYKLIDEHALKLTDMRPPPERRAPPPPPPAPETVIVSWGLGGFSFDFSGFDDGATTTTTGRRGW